MKIGVLVKQVPDTETKVKVKDGGIDEEGVKWVVNPYDEIAVEEALKVKEKVTGEVVVISMGPAKAVEAIRTCLAMGADRGIYIDSTGLVSDSYITATVLAGALKNENFDLIFCGKQAVDYDASSVVQMVAEILNMPHVMVVEKIELKSDNKGATVYRRVGGGSKEVIDVNFPALIGCEKGLNTPRYPSLPGIMKAKTKPMANLKASELSNGSKPKIEIMNFRLPPERAAGKILHGEPEQVVLELVKLLREEAKVI